MKYGLIRGRHEIAEVEEYIFEDAIADVKDVDALYCTAMEKMAPYASEGVDLYVTGLTVACAAVIKAAYAMDIRLSLWHYDVQSGSYFEQVIHKPVICPFCGQPSGNGYFCKSCGAS